MPTILSGSQTAIGTSTAVLSTQRVLDMADEIALLEPDAAPLTAFMRQMQTGREAFNPEFSWLEDVLAPKVTAVATGCDASQTGTMIVTAGDGTKIASGDLIKNTSSGEIFLVSSVSTDTPTIVRGFGTTAGATMNVGDTLLIIGNANAENATIRDIKATQTTRKANYCQIFRTPFGMSRTLKDSKLYGGNYKTYQAKKKGIEHRVEMERQFLFGEPKEQTNSDSGRWATGGLDYFITTNRVDASKQVTYPGLVDLTQTVFRYGNQKRRLCLAAPSIISAVDKFSSERLFLQTSTEVYGIRVSKVQSSHGDLMLVKHPLLQETAAYNERMFVLDMDKISERPFVNANTKLKQNIQAPSADGEQHEYITQTGLELQNEVAHAVYYNAI